ncbi:galactose-1-phosphate uridylyltransferase [Candidatus Bipolaricaulota bacterium]|nr:galactose-1-phosphate uridylyltransferase [Candidatus Bipolaricaulota bacterium]
MPELRRGLITQKWVIIAPERAMRPSDYRTDGDEALRQPLENCPFCPGHEHMTPPEVYRVSDGKNGWRVRVVPNKYAALTSYPELGRAGVAGFFDRMNGVGAHEVVIETPDHDKELPDLTEDHLKVVVDVYALRLRELMKNGWHRYVLLFKNHGSRAGASLAHPHAQIIATPVVPGDVRARLHVAKDYYDRKERCVFCDMLLQELHEGQRVVAEVDGYVILAPYDSRFPFEIHIYPRYHAHDFTAMNEEQRRGLARVLRQALGALKALLGDPPYNFVLQTAPNPVPRPGKPGYWATLQYDYHWHIEVIPRLTRVAGFEWGTGFYINPMPPEDAARYLREALEQG